METMLIVVGGLLVAFAAGLLVVGRVEDRQTRAEVGRMYDRFAEHTERQTTEFLRAATDLMAVQKDDVASRAWAGNRALGLSRPPPEDLEPDKPEEGPPGPSVSILMSREAEALEDQEE